MYSLIDDHAFGTLTLLGAFGAFLSQTSLYFISYCARVVNWVWYGIGSIRFKIKFLFNFFSFLCFSDSEDGFKIDQTQMHFWFGIIFSYPCFFFNGKNGTCFKSTANRNIKFSKKSREASKN